MKLIKPSYRILDHISDDILSHIEIAGRTCYKSEDLITDDSAEKFVRMIIKRGHESVLEHEKVSVRVICDRGCCYSCDTKVLTENGFKYFYDIERGEKIYTLDESGALKLINYKKVIQKKYVGNLLNFRSTQVDLMVTPNHNMWVYDYHKRIKENKIWKFIEAQKMSNSRYKFYKSCKQYLGTEKPVIIRIPEVRISRGIYTKKYPALNFEPFAFLQLLGIWITDGCLCRGKNGSGNRIVITQVKKTGRKSIEELLQYLKIEYSCYDKEYRLKAPQLYKWLVDNFIEGGDFKKSYYLRIPNWIKRLSNNYINSLLTGIMIGDGCEMADGRKMIYTASLPFAEDLVELILKVGRSANINIVKRKSKQRIDGYEIYSKVPQYVVNIINTQEHLFNKTQKTFKEVHYHGYVYCVELPEYHRLYVMRNGKACWCGNSHEIVRHRIASYSQESTRYCNYQGGVAFIIPPWIDLKPGVYQERFVSVTTPEQVWLHCMCDAELHYKQLIRFGWTPQQARSVLPNSLKTEIVMTMNLREWRHFFKLRTAKAAHPQMREIACPMLEEFKELIPAVFEDINF